MSAASWETAANFATFVGAVVSVVTLVVAVVGGTRVASRVMRQLRTRRLVELLGAVRDQADDLTMFLEGGRTDISGYVALKLHGAIVEAAERHIPMLTEADRAALRTAAECVRDIHQGLASGEDAGVLRDRAGRCSLHLSTALGQALGRGDEAAQEV